MAKRVQVSKRSTLFGGLFILFGVVLASTTFYLYQVFNTPNLLVKQGKMRLKIPTGANFNTVMDSLMAANALTDPISFAFVARWMDYQKQVKPGLYLLQADMSNREAIRLLQKGEQLPINITLSTARLKSELPDKLCNQLEANPAEFAALLNDETVCAQAGFNTENILCMFLPNTYEVYWTYTAEKLFNRFKREYDKFWNQDRREKAKALDLTPIEVSILASIVEGETQKTDERPRVAGVYLNRLKRGIPLQADPTVVFAVGDFSIRRVLEVHLQTESPYNTYKYKGLPPGPINLPSLSSIEAVLNAEKHNYLFFCAREDLSGYHNFAENGAQHQANAEKYRRALNKMKIYR